MSKELTPLEALAIVSKGIAFGVKYNDFKPYLDIVETALKENKRLKEDNLYLELNL